MSRIFALLALVFLSAVFFAPRSSAVENFRLLENEIRLVLKPDSAEFSLAVENPAEEFSANVKLEILAPDDSVLAQNEFSSKIVRGRQNLSATLAFAQKIVNESEVVWSRLRYEIASAAAPDQKTSGLISFSQILPEIFELKTMASFPVADNRFAVRVMAVNPITQNGVGEVEIDGLVEIESRQLPLRANAKTDAEGFALLAFDLPDAKDYADLNLKITGRKNGFSREIEDDPRFISDKFAEIAPDKSLYQPAQTVNLRIFFYNQNRNPVKNAELSVEIENEVADERVFSEMVKTSRFGLASVSWKIPENARLGNYRIKVKNTEGNAIGFSQIKITRYDLPNFYVEARPDRNFYLPENPTAKISVEAKYLFGKPLANGKVRLVSSKYDDDLLKEISGNLDADGKFTAEIDLSQAFEEFKDERGRFRDLRLTAFVTDPTTNRSEPRSFTLRLTREPIHVYLVGNNYNQSGRLPLDFYVTTFYADGTPAACEVGVFELVKKDADGAFVTPELGTKFAKIQTNAYGAGKLRLPYNFEQTDFEIKLVATDGKGLQGVFETDIDAEDKPALKVETDKIAYRKGETSRVTLTSSESKKLVLVDVAVDSIPVYTTQVRLENNRAELEIPYRAEFRNAVEIVAYFDDDDELIVGRKNIIYPTPTNLALTADTRKDVFRPGEQVAVKFRARRSDQQSPLTVALGVLVLDRAVEERARTESENGYENAFLNRTFASPMTEFLGNRKVFGNFTVRDIKNLDLQKPLAPDFEIALEVTLDGIRYRPELNQSESVRDDLDKLFAPYFRKKMLPIADALNEIARSDRPFPTDERILSEVLAGAKIDFAALRDAWGNLFQTEFRFNRNQLTLEIWSFGADKKAKTGDDLTVLKSNWNYFQSIGRALDRAFAEYARETGAFITDFAVLQTELGKRNIDLKALRDPWGNPYRFEFTIERTNYVIAVKSLGPDRQADSLGTLNPDDFLLWTSRADYFTVTKNNLVKDFNRYVKENERFPRDEAEMRIILQKSGFDINAVKDIFGRPYYIQVKESPSNIKFYRSQAKKMKIVKQKILTFALKSSGTDGVQGNFDDFELAQFTGAAVEEEIESTQGLLNRKLPSDSFGAIGGTVVDSNWAVIPNATVTVRNAAKKILSEINADEEGYFFIDKLPTGAYELTVKASGFKNAVIMNLKAEPSVLLEIEVLLEVGSGAVMVDVSMGDSTINTTNSRLDTNVVRNKPPSSTAGVAPSFTPRVRDYFAETLVWAPEIVTNEKGEAELKFKMADSLTTWKMYVVGSDEDGNFGLVEKELQTFQPFFAEIEPPRILTEGDRLALPVPVRNYTDRRQKVAVTLAPNDWSKPLGKETQTLDIPADSSVNAVFDFRAVAPVTDGKQKVTATAGRDADAIEKNVTVRPNGEEKTATQTVLFKKETTLEINFPADAFPKTHRAELKIYPNMFAHVAESVEGLLKRPSGCGEQTLSSTYPNLLILKIEKNLGREIEPRIKAQAQKFLADGYRRLLNYQTDAGFGYWNGDSPDIALTAYALKFLRDAADFIEVDETRIEKAEKWLLSMQKTDGSWDDRRKNGDALTAYILRTLSQTVKNDRNVRKSLQNGLDFFKNRLAEIEDPFVLANLALVALELKDAETADTALEILRKSAIAEKAAVFWSSAETPFFGWGAAGRIETTALVLQAFIKSTDEKRIANDSLIGQALLFLLRSKDRHGVWYSTQTTVNVLDALVLFEGFRASQNSDATGEIFINGQKVQEFSLVGKGLRAPFVTDVSKFLTTDKNRVEIKTSVERNLILAQTVAVHYAAWSKTAENNRYFDLAVKFDKISLTLGEDVTCRVAAVKKFAQSGMTLAEIGLPPGADVDRASLEKAKTENYLSSYDILPDRLIVYSWQSNLDFSFKFRPRFRLEAQTAPSVVYDYYNEEAKRTLAPQKFEVR